MPTNRAELTTGLLPNLMFVGNGFVEGNGTGEYEHVNPATGRVQRTYRLASEEDVDGAVRAAARAFSTWKDTAPGDRRRLLEAVANALRERQDEFAQINALEVGAPLNFGRAIVQSAADWFDYYAGWADKIGGDTLPLSSGSGISLTLKEPIGVVAKILTWNAPLSGIAMGVAPALAAGCSVVIKPAETAPFAALRFAEICAGLGFPADVINVVIGDHVAGNALVRHPDIAKISFTGGPETARKISEAAAQNLTPLVLELGGKSANIIFADADMHRAIEHAAAILFNSGQGCSLPSRLLVERGIYETVVDRLAAAFARIRVGDPFASDTAMGPVISEAAANEIVARIERSVNAGEARLVVGGCRLGGPLKDGAYVAPTLLCDVDPRSSAAQEEFFGPVLCVIPFDTEEEALTIANSTRFGLAGYIHSGDHGRVMRMVKGLKAGGVGVNGNILPASPMVPFGGSGLSGYGREGGREGIEEFLHAKTVIFRF